MPAPKVIPLNREEREREIMNGKGLYSQHPEVYSQGTVAMEPAGHYAQAVPVSHQPGAAPTVHAAQQGYYDQSGRYISASGPSTGYSTVAPVVTSLPHLGTTERIVNNYIPPHGRWKDGICDCCNNVWPSCYCSCACFHGAYLVSQIAHKTQFAQFRVLFTWYLVTLLTFIVLASIFDSLWMIFPSLMVYLVAISLRLHLVRIFDIRQSGDFVEFLTACCCCCCSISQMARHVFGYTAVFDGDSSPEPKYHNIV